MGVGKQTTWGYVWRGLLLLFCVGWAGLSVRGLQLMHGDFAEFDDKGVAAVGVVVKIHTRGMSGEGGRVTSDPEVQFQTPDGKLVTFIDRSAVDLGVVVGQQVNVLYMPDRPDYAKIDAPGQDTFETMILGMFIVFIVVGTIGAGLCVRALVRYTKLKPEVLPGLASPRAS